MQTLQSFTLAAIFLLIGSSGEHPGPGYAPLTRPETKGILVHSEDFESGAWDDNFLHPNWCQFDYSCKNITNPYGTGRVFQAEYRSENCNGERETMGDELATKEIKYDEQWLGIRIYFDSEKFGFDSQPMVLLQHHGKPDCELGESWRNPVTAMKYSKGELTLSYRGSKERVTPIISGYYAYSDYGTITLGEVNENAWNNFVIHTIWDSTGNSGLLEIWHDGIHYKLNDINISYNDAQRPYLKFGQYNWRCNSDDPVRISYYDDLIIVAGPEAGFCDVVPPGSPLPEDIMCK